jgi:hypothetical protein
LIQSRIVSSAIAASLSFMVGVTSAGAAEIRGSLTGIDSLQPTRPAEITGRRSFYWNEPNAALGPRPARANPEMDLAMIVTGDGVAEMTRPVSVPVVGGRCQPGTVVVAPNGVVSVQNQDWFPREFFVAAQGSTTPLASFQPEVTAPRSERQGQIADAGTYMLLDRTAPTFRCWIVVGSGQGKIFTPASDGTFHLGPFPDGTYTVRTYFEGRMLNEQTAAIAREHDATVPAINLAAPPTPPAGAAANAATPPAAGANPAPGTAPPAAGAAPANAPPAAAAPASDTGHHHHHGH